MPNLTCPRCGNSGELRCGDGHFQDVWPEVRGHLPVRRCTECDAGIVVSTKLLTLGMHASSIPDDVWYRMEEEGFGRAMAPVPVRRGRGRF